MNLKFLETFFWLAKLRNFSVTAERLNTTQPAISSRLRALEDQLGVELLFRTTREVHLTPAGIGLLRHVEAILEEMRQIRERLGLDGDIAGVVRIGVVDAIVRTWLPTLFELLRERHPLLSLEVTVDTTLQLARALREGDLHLVIAIEPVSGEHLASAPICSYAMGWVCRPDMITAGKRYEPSDIAALPLITYPPQTPPSRLIADYFQDLNLSRARTSASNSMSTMIELAADGLGVAAVPPVCVEREISEGRLAAIESARAFPPLTFVASYRSVPSHAAITATLEACRAAAAAFCSTRPSDAACVTNL
ncbi:LysR family transcriptional regulator [Terrarubrum flagellatum]|uniref:LysR family transcriptional regulator n=1 Tax=Terrirubrum flagellatum TaxID=2895980 RepID=UPI0031451F54